MANTDLSSVILGTYGVIKPPPPPPVEERWWWQRVHHRRTGKHEKKFWWQQSTLNRRWLNGLEPPWRTKGHRSYHKKHHSLEAGWWFEGPSLKEYHTHVPIQPQTRRLLQVLRRNWSPIGSKLQFSGCVADYGRGCRPWLARATPARCARPQERKEVVSIATVWGDSLWHWACESSVGLLAAPPSLGPAGTAHLHVTNASLTFETSEGAFVHAWLRRLGFGHLVDQGRIVAGCVRAERATMLPTGRCAAPSRRHLTWLSERLRRGAPPLEPRTALVVTRKDRGARNWAAVREVVARRFDVVIDHDDNAEGGLGPLDDQLAHFARAAVIVAPHGSGLFGLAATAPEACVVEFFPERYLNLCYAAVARKLDRTYRGLLIDSAGDAELAALPGVLDECALRRRNATRGM